MNSNRVIAAWTMITELASHGRTFVSPRHVCLACRDAADVSGVGLALAGGPGRWDPVVATDEKTAELEELQFTLGEGPTADAFASRRPVLVPDLAAAGWRDRWPMFTAAAIGHGVRAVFAFPIQVAEIQAGVVNLYRDAAAPLSRAQFTDTLIYADAALLLALDDLRGAGDPSRVVSEGDFDEWRAEVNQAARMASVQMKVTVEEALARLRAHAYVGNRRLLEVAQDVLSRKLRFTTSEGERAVGGESA